MAVMADLGKIMDAFLLPPFSPLSPHAGVVVQLVMEKTLLFSASTIFRSVPELDSATEEVTQSALLSSLPVSLAITNVLPG